MNNPHHNDQKQNSEPQESVKPIATLAVIAVLLLVTLAFWMMVLGVQQGRA